MSAQKEKRAGRFNEKRRAPTQPSWLGADGATMRGLDGKIGRQAFAYLNLTAFCSCYGRWKVDAILGLGDERFVDDGNGFPANAASA